MFGPENDSYLDGVLGEQASKRYFRPDETDPLTRMAAKALALELHEGGPRSLFDLARDGDTEDVAARLRHDIACHLRHCTLSSLLKHLRHWAGENGLALDAGAYSWETLAVLIDWNWVLMRLGRELTLHGQRAERRAEELRQDMPYEHIEAALERGRRSKPARPAVTPPVHQADGTLDKVGVAAASEGSRGTSTRRRTGAKGGGAAGVGGTDIGPDPQTPPEPTPDPRDRKVRPLLWVLKTPPPPTLPSLEDYNPLVAWGDDTATKRQLKELRSFGLVPRRRLNMSEAHHLIAECIRRVEGQRLDAAQRERLEQLRQWNEGVEYRGIRKLYSECEKEDGF